MSPNRPYLDLGRLLGPIEMAADVDAADCAPAVALALLVAPEMP